MALQIARPPAHLPAGDALRLSQQAPHVLKSKSSWSLPWPLSLVFTSDAPEKWSNYENLFFSCLRTGDDKSASQCLEYLKERFGETNERVMGLVGLYHEAIAQNDTHLAKILSSYSEALEESPSNMVVRKRRVALLKSMNKPKEAIAALVELLDLSPIDAEAWAELSDLYFAQGMYQQSIFCLEEVLLVTPNAWNIHAKLAEVIYISSSNTASNEAMQSRDISRSMKSFCRSIELCDDYLRGYYGLKITTNYLKTIMSDPVKSTAIMKEAVESDSRLARLNVIQQLNEIATEKLGEIIRKHSSKQSGWEGYEENEIIAARALLDRDGSLNQR